MLTLTHTWGSICSIKTRLALEQKALDIGRVLVDLLAFEQRKPDDKRLTSPLGGT